MSIQASTDPCSMLIPASPSRPVAEYGHSGGSNFQLGILDPLFPFPASSSSSLSPNGHTLTQHTKSMESFRNVTFEMSGSSGPPSTSYRPAYLRPSQFMSHFTHSREVFLPLHFTPTGSKFLQTDTHSSTYFISRCLKTKPSQSTRPLPPATQKILKSLYSVYWSVLCFFPSTTHHTSISTRAPSSPKLSFSACIALQVKEKYSL